MTCWKRCSASIGPRSQEEAPPGLTGEDECEKTWKGLELATHRDLASGLFMSQDLVAAQKDGAHAKKAELCNFGDWNEQTLGCET